MGATKTLKILRNRRNSRYNLIASFFKEQSVLGYMTPWSRLYYHSKTYSYRSQFISQQVLSILVWLD